MNKAIKLTTFNDSIAIALDPTMVLVTYDNEGFEYSNGEIHGTGSVVPSFTLETKTVDELRQLPFHLFLVERISRIYGLMVLLSGILNADPKLMYLGFFCVLPFFKCFIRFVSLLINSSEKYRKLFKKGFQHRAATNKVINAINDLGRIPTVKEAMEYEMVDKSGSITVDTFIGFTYAILIPMILVSPTNFIIGFGFPATVAVLFFILYYFYNKGYFDKFEKKVLERPEERDIALAILALTIYASLTGDIHTMSGNATVTTEESSEKESDK